MTMNPMSTNRRRLLAACALAAAAATVPVLATDWSVGRSEQVQVTIERDNGDVGDP